MTDTVLTIPDYWLKCPKIGQLIQNTPFILCKTPIDIDIPYYDTTSFNDTYYQFTITQLIHYFHTNTTKYSMLGLIINLTDCIDKPLYDSTICQQHNIKHVNITIPSSNNIFDDHKSLITTTRLFNSIVNKYLDTNNNQSFTQHTIVVHDTYGYNISGYCTASYLIDECNYTLTKALSDISFSRLPGIYNRDALVSLQLRFGTTDDIITIPKPPVWDKSATNNIKSTSIHKSTTSAYKVQSTSHTINQLQSVHSNITQSSSSDTNKHKLQERGVIQSAPVTNTTSVTPDGTNKRHKPDTASTSTIQQYHTYLNKIDDIDTIQSVNDTINKLVPNTHSYIKYETITSSTLHVISPYKSYYTVSWYPDCYTCILLLHNNIAYLSLSTTELYTINNYPVYELQNNTIAIGELVIDCDKKTDIISYRLLIVDLLYMSTDNNISIMQQPLEVRLTEAQRILIDQSNKYSNNNTLQQCQMRLRIKKMYTHMNVAKSIAMINTLPHKANGIILYYNQSLNNMVNKIYKYNWLVDSNDVKPTDLINTFTT